MATKTTLKCNRCNLATKCRTNKISGCGSEGREPSIIIFLDNPTDEDDRRHKSGFSKYVQLIYWMLEKMSISKEHVRIEYSIRCYGEKNIKTKAQYEPIIDACRIHTVAILQQNPNAILIGMGALTCFMFKGKQQVGEYAGCEWNFWWRKMKIWITYSPAYVFQKSSEAPAIYRVFFRAAEQA